MVERTTHLYLQKQPILCHTWSSPPFLQLMIQIHFEVYISHETLSQRFLYQLKKKTAHLEGKFD